MSKSCQNYTCQNCTQEAKHDFNQLRVLQHSCATPLTTLLLNLNLIEQSLAEADCKSNCHFYLQKALLASHYLKKIMDNCHPVEEGALPTASQHKFAVADSLREVLVLAQRQSPSCQLISFIKLSDNLRLSGSKLHFQESIICLLNNAFEAYQPSAGNKLVVLHADQEQEQIKISVVDGGVGFSQDTKQLATQGGAKDDRDSQESMPKLADSAQTDSGQAIKGRSGVGLDFVTNTIQHRFQGQVEVNSQPGKGTTINCYLPLK